MPQMASFTVFYRAYSGEGGYICRSCEVYRNSTFSSVVDAFALAVQHLNTCQSVVPPQPREGTAIVNGDRHPLVFHEGVMILAVNVVFRASPPSPLRLVV